jgi:hypothetical protein
VAVQERQSSALCGCFCQSPLEKAVLEARISMDVSISFTGKDEAMDQGGSSRSAPTWKPQRKAQILLAVATQEMLASNSIHIHRQGGTPLGAAHCVSHSR